MLITQDWIPTAIELIALTEQPLLIGVLHYKTGSAILFKGSIKPMLGIGKPSTKIFPYHWKGREKRIPIAEITQNVAETNGPPDGQSTNADMRKSDANGMGCPGTDKHIQVIVYIYIYTYYSIYLENQKYKNKCT